MEVELGRYQEYRIEVTENQKFKIMVIMGLAEIKGQELLNDKWYVFSDIKAAIFTFTGAKLRIDGNCELQYTVEKLCFRKIFNYFDDNKKSNKTVLVLGKGRSTFCATISNYFVRMHKQTDLIEIDPSKGNIFPGTLSLLHVDTLVDCQENFKLNNPICFFYGSLIVENKELYELQTSALAEYLQKNSFDMETFKMIIAPELTIDETNNIIKKFRVSEVVIIGDERLFHKINYIVPKFFIENDGYICENRVSKSINRYFNGYNNEFTPCSFIVKYDWNIVRIGELYSAPESALPLGATRKVGKTDICKTELAENSILAISEAESEENLATTPVVGFIVCLDEKKFRILCTQPKLPKLKFLIQGDFKYIDF